MCFRVRVDVFQDVNVFAVQRDAAGGPRAFRFHDGGDLGIRRNFDDTTATRRGDVNDPACIHRRSDRAAKST